MRITVCELPHEPAALAAAWDGLCAHAAAYRSELVLLPEFAFVEPVWEMDRFEPARWAAIEAAAARWLERLSDLGGARVVGAGPATEAGRPFNQGFLWSADAGLTPLRRKRHLPDEPGGWEARWFDPGDTAFPTYHAGRLSFGLNICTELWALETYAWYADAGVEAILSPRATAAATGAKWLSVGVVAAVRSGAFSVSSNRVDWSGRYGGGGWIIGPDGHILARTTVRTPWATVEIDPAQSIAARGGYPRYVFGSSGRES